MKADAQGRVHDGCEGTSRNTGNSNAKGKRPRIIRHPRVERWDQCRECGKQVDFDTKNGRLVARNPDGTAHPCVNA